MRDFCHEVKAGPNSLVTTYKVKVLDLVEVRMGWQWEARVVERFCEFTVDGVPGWGISEWHWRAYGGRPKALEETDPPHTKDVEKY